MGMGILYFPFVILSEAKNLCNWQRKIAWILRSLRKTRHPGNKKQREASNFAASR
jgi:hypothetical protein